MRKSFCPYFSIKVSVYLLFIEMRRGTKSINLSGFHFCSLAFKNESESRYKFSSPPLLNVTPIKREHLNECECS